MELRAIAGRYVIEGHQLAPERPIAAVHAHDRLTGRTVLVETLSTGADSALAATFQRERTAFAQIHHRNVIRILDFGEFEEQGRTKAYCVMPFLGGNTLLELLRNAPGGLPAELAVNIMVQVSLGLRAIHDFGLVHRNLTPAYILVTPDRVARILLSSSLESPRRFSTNSMGTAAYLSPDQMIGLFPVTPRSDIFSLGAVCYEALTGKPPKSGEPLQAIDGSGRPLASGVSPAINHLLTRVLKRAMEKDPDRRFATATAFGRALLYALREGDRVAEARTEADGTWAGATGQQLEMESGDDTWPFPDSETRSVEISELGTAREAPLESDPAAGSAASIETPLSPAASAPAVTARPEVYVQPPRVSYLASKLNELKSWVTGGFASKGGKSPDK